MKSDCRALLAPLTLATLLLAGPLSAQQARDLSPYLIASRTAEIALARSAAPRAIGDAATVLVLTRSGYITAATGANGFTCLVVRQFNAPIGDPDFWNPRVRAPHCFNPPAAQTVLPEMLTRAEWIMGGVSETEIASRTSGAYASHDFPLPAPGAMAYMMSREQHLTDADPQWMPHLMFYYDRSLPGSAWGAGDMTAPVIDATAGQPAAPVQTLLVPVRQWSDGTPAQGH